MPAFRPWIWSGTSLRALLAYEGIQYRYMAPAVFTSDALEYVQEHLRILSGFYGVLRPFDGVRPYRLEMQAKLKTDFCASLYDFWGRTWRGCWTRRGVAESRFCGVQPQQCCPTCRTAFG